VSFFGGRFSRGVFPGEDPVYEGATGDPWPGGVFFRGVFGGVFLARFSSVVFLRGFFEGFFSGVFLGVF
jgi:hypothetical protein